jgi:hypothetical protein
MKAAREEGVPRAGRSNGVHCSRAVG